MCSYSFVLTPSSLSPKVQLSLKRKKIKHEEVAGRISRLQPVPSAKYMGIGSGGERADMLNVSNCGLGKNQQRKQSMVLLELLKGSFISVIACTCYYNLSLFISH